MYETMTMAQACGEAPMPALAFIPGEDFDPYDDDDRDAVGAAMERERYDTVTALQAEITALRAALAATRDDGDEYDPREDHDPYD